MKIIDTYSHLVGEEWLLIHRPDEYKGLLKILQTVTLGERTSDSYLQSGTGPLEAALEVFDEMMQSQGWHHLEGVRSDAACQELMSHGTLVATPTQTEYLKAGVAASVHLAERSLALYGLYSRSLMLYLDRRINVGIEILPTKAMQKEMSSGIAYYEGELHNILRGGRNNPPVPLVLLGIEPE